MANVVEVPLDFSHLKNLDDGRINKLLEHHLGNISRDCINRPGDKTKRKVTLVFYATPDANDDGDAEAADVQVECFSKIPIYRSRKFKMRLSNKGFTFNQDFPDALDQPSLFPKQGEQPAE